MDSVRQFLEAKIQRTSDFTEREVLPCLQEIDVLLEDFGKYAKALAKAIDSGDYGSVNKTKHTLRREFMKENSCPNTEVPSNKDHNDDRQILKQVKKEKISAVHIPSTGKDAVDMPAPTIIPSKNKRVKKERKTSTIRVKQEPNPEPRSTRLTPQTSSTRTSDVILCNKDIPVIELCDSEEEKTEKAPVRSTRTRTKKKAVEEVENSSATTRSTRTKTKKVAESESESEPSVAPTRVTRTKTRAIQKRERSGSGNQRVAENHKRSKSDPKTENDEVTNMSGRTEYEDANSELDGKSGDATFSKKTVETSPTKSNAQIMDKTMIIEKPQASRLLVPSNAEDLLTDDESMEEQKTSPQKAVKNCKKEVFSPYDQSPVKKKVEAFEKIKDNKAKAAAKLNTSRILSQIEENKGNVKEKAKCFTPVATKLLSKPGSSSASGISKYIGYKSAINDSTIKSSTPMKSPIQHTSRTDFKLREMKRQEREKELQKKELAKRAMSEDRRKKFEEKMLKVQQQKETLEREKIKALEAQRLKEEKHKMLLQQREEKYKLMRKENETKRLLAKQRAEEKKKEEEAQKLASQEKLNEIKKAEITNFRAQVAQKAIELPIYMRKAAPLLPTYDCYDSDDENNRQTKHIAAWTQKRNLISDAIMQEDIGHKIKNTFFCCQSHRIDLREIFEQIDARKLKRTSSAVWERAPRFTMLPHFEED
ncbi:hypothetical protein HHI36_002234 [Cryptolaemus montrouzieri]|uniref:Uncharacterized protein n=1 Tax=Cryptolaemus montrouzieri TaxID=559131 RepID=A0ABD2PAN9_9CUCU